MPVPFTANFRVDLRDAFVGLLRQSGFTVDDSAEMFEVLHMYFNARRLLIEPVPRKVHRSREVAARTLTDSQRRALGAIEARALVGKPLQPYQSTRIESADYNDLLLNDWGVHHLHLGLGRHPTKPWFAARTRDLLFALVRPDNFYMIDVLPHGEWVNEALVDIMHTNWPEAIADRVCPGVTDVDPLSRDSRARLRKVHANTLIAASDGTAYHLGGLVSSGLALEVVMASDKVAQRAVDEEKLCRENADAIVAHLTEKLGRAPQELRLRRKLHEGAFFIMEELSNIRIDFAPPPLGK